MSPSTPVIRRFASQEEAEANPQYSGLDPHTGVLFYGKPLGQRGAKYTFTHGGEHIVVFRAIQSRYTGIYKGQANGQAVLSRYEVEGVTMYRIMPGERPFYLERNKIVLPSGKVQVFGLWWMPRDLLLICF